MNLSKHKMGLVAVMCLLLMLIVLGACAKQEEQGGAAETNTNTPAGTGTAAENVPQADEPPTPLRFFYGDSGVPHAEGVDPSDNRYINIVEQLANVDLEVEVPGYQDYETKFNLMMSSGNLPDLVHTWLLPAATKFGDEGAFIDLKSFYDHSPAIQNVITPEMMELAKSPSGHYYRIPMAWDKGPQGAGLVVRTDLIDKYNGGVFPDSIEGYADVLRKIKRENPDSIPMSNRVVGANAITYGGNSFYNLLGANPYTDRIVDGEVISNFTTPEYRYVTELMRALYSEGVLDQEFATNDSEKWTQRWYGDYDTLFSFDSADQLVGTATAPLLPGAISPANRYMYAPPISTFPDVVKDVRYTESFKGLPISGHGLYIPSTSTNPEAAWRTIEALASDEFYSALWYGFEGEHYTVVNGEKVFDFDKLADPAINWKLHLNFVFGFTAGQEVSKAKNMSILGEELGAKTYASLQPYADQAEKNGVFALNITNAKISDEAKQKLPELPEFISKATIEAIMSRISMEEFDQRVAEFQTQYAFIYDEKTKAYADNKDQLASMGVNILDF